MPSHFQNITTNSESETEAFARALASHLQGGMVVSLEGDLGAGKTFLARALARQLGISEPITSPTFVLQKLYAIPEHPSIHKLAHYDFYRIQHYDELMDMGFEDHDADTLVLCEWGDLFVSEFPCKPVRIRIEALSETTRQISVSGLSALLS